MTCRLAILLAGALCCAQPAPPSAAVLEGRVLDGATRMPLSGASLVLQRIENGTRLGGEEIWKAEPAAEQDPEAVISAIVTGLDGLFRFRLKAPGRYAVYCSREGYVRFSDFSGVTVQKAGEFLQRDFSLMPEGQISGRILDRETGRPVPGLSVRAFSQWESAQAGTFIPHGEAGTTNPEGQFVVQGLSPGEYYLEARPAIRREFLPPGPDEQFRDKDRREYGPTWYPNALTREESAPVRLLTGNRLDGLEFRLDKRRMGRIRGRLTAVEPGAAEASVTLYRIDHSWDSQSFAVEVSGKLQTGKGFQVDGLAPGSYWLYGRLPGPDTGRTQVANLVFELADEPVDGLDLHLGLGLELGGRVVLAPREGVPPDPPLPLPEDAKLFVDLSSTRRSSTPEDDAAKVATDGGFRFNGLSPDHYRVSVSGVPPGYLQAEVFYNGKFAPHGVVSIAAGAERQELTVYLRPPGGSLQVSVTDGSNPAPEAQVLVVAEPVDEHALRRIQIRAKSDSNGKAQFAQLMTGEFRVIAFPAGYSWSFDRNLLNRFRAAPAVKVAGGGPQSLTVRLQD
jgi:hypothetical protein